MTRIMRENRCWNGEKHISEAKIAFKSEYIDDEQMSRCINCHQPLTRFWIDEEPGERTGSWSWWVSTTYVIEEIGP